MRLGKLGEQSLRGDDLSQGKLLSVKKKPGKLRGSLKRRKVT
jgi:hypothetical protein